mmetsp:Transcript_120949/g.349470  ORF Transcript_120949/g.349470 Transcript_120949/m.349470 type:complete len:302 (-) Transcript_120949:75-980(-)
MGRKPSLGSTSDMTSSEAASSASSPELDEEASDRALGRPGTARPVRALARGPRSCGIHNDVGTKSALALRSLSARASNGLMAAFARSSSSSEGAVMTTQALGAEARQALRMPSQRGWAKFPAVASMTTTASTGTAEPQGKARTPCQTLSTSGRQMSGSRPSTSGPHIVCRTEWEWGGARRRNVQQPLRNSMPTSWRMMGPSPVSSVFTNITSSPVHGSIHFWKRPAPSAASRHSRTAWATASVRYATASSKGRRPEEPPPSHSMVNESVWAAAPLEISAPTQRSSNFFHLLPSSPSNSLMS